jgi:hypothetical protein
MLPATHFVFASSLLMAFIFWHLNLNFILLNQFIFWGIIFAFIVILTTSVYIYLFFFS